MTQDNTQENTQIEMKTIRIYAKDQHGDTRTFEVPADTDLTQQDEIKKFIRSEVGISLKGAILSSLKERPIPRQTEGEPA